MPGIFDLTGKVCVVTGANRGIGFAMARGLAEAGAQAVIWGSQANRNAEALELLKASGLKSSAQTVDVADEAQVVDAMSAVHREFGRIDAVFANAGINRATPFLELTADDLRRIMNVNMDGALWTLREGARYMVARARDGEPGGSLIGTASMGAIMGAAGYQAYTGAKAALAMMLKSIAVELGPYGIRANSILPGHVATEMASALGNEEAEKRIFARTPLGRWGAADEFAGIAVYLASEASSFHTGDSIVIDGGYSIKGI